MKAVLCTVGALLVLVGSAPATACGHCVEDKVAAVYDHGVESRARLKRHHVAYFAIDGPLVVNPAVKRSIEAILSSTDGVDKNSVHVSLELAALSFSFDPRRKSFASAQQAIEKKLAPSGLRLMELKFIDATGVKQ